MLEERCHMRLAAKELRIQQYQKKKTAERKEAQIARAAEKQLRQDIQLSKTRAVHSKKLAAPPPDVVKEPKVDNSCTAFFVVGVRRPKVIARWGRSPDGVIAPACSAEGYLLLAHYTNSTPLEETMDTGLPFRSVENDTSTYTPLDPSTRQIRCISIAPGYGSSPLVCNLIYLSLNDAGYRLAANYEALSYCWGDLSTVVPITLVHPKQSSTDIDKAEQVEQTFYVTADLHCALLNFRRILSARILWVDAICINQNDPVERSQQVSSMGQIYSSAERVLVWLGVENIWSEVMMRLMEIWDSRSEKNYSLDAKIDLSMLIDKDREWFLELPQKFSNLRIWTWELPESDSAPAIYGACDLEKQYGLLAPFWMAYATDLEFRRSMITAYITHGNNYSPTELAQRIQNPVHITLAVKWAVDAFFSRPWFKRVWVIQEVFRAPLDTHGQPKVKLVIGDVSVDWERFCNFTRDLAAREETMNAGIHHFPMVRDKPSGLAFFKGSWLSLWQRGIMDRNQFIPILDVIETTGVFQASDRADKIYAILELGSDTRENMSHHRLRPDYVNKLADFAMFDFARWHIGTKKSLDLLNFFPGYHPKQSLRWGNVPQKYSWVPDIIRTDADWPFTNFIHKECPGFLNGNKNHECDQALKRSFTFRDSSFYIGGLIFSEISTVFRYRHVSGTTFTIGQQGHEVFTFIRNEMRTWSQEPNGAIFMERAIRMFGIMDSEHDMHLGFINYLHNREMVKADADDPSWKAYCEKHNYQRERDDRKHLWNRFEHRLNSFHKERRLFLTKDGTPGLGPELMFPGDIVVGLYTGRTPYVLRPCRHGKDHYQMLGPCLLYDQRPMDDERYQPKPGQSLKLFEIL
ncbi:HET-domain-containing protein [Westerdykella ornata]|uniref:HET-domain-containing protein n=1 Tax=Westerdykella ornata TaxID=318751 RepID=A0A6A6J9D7_WESOR|nr:HET-domain-containing protein [Westerdykella ornata]KAF2271839.1 HET-domain-containing protein [Westerdykella ornata]